MSGYLIPPHPGWNVTYDMRHPLSPQREGVVDLSWVYTLLPSHLDSLPVWVARATGESGSVWVERWYGEAEGILEMLRKGEPGMLRHRGPPVPALHVLCETGVLDPHALRELWLVESTAGIYDALAGALQ